MRRLLMACACGLAVGVATNGATADEKQTQEIKAQDVTLVVPQSWKQQRPSSQLRLAQLSIDAAEGDREPAELVVSGPFGGTVSDNVKRWLAQFQAEGRQATMVQGEAPQGKYVLVDMTGTYNKPDGPPIRQQTKPTPGYRVVNVMLMTPDHGNYFLKLTGPEKTVGNWIDALRASFGADKSKESPFQL